MSHENDPLPIEANTPIASLNNADSVNQTLFYSSDWSSSNNLPVPAVILEWTTPVLPSVPGKGYLYVKPGLTDLFFSTSVGELNITATNGTITGPVSSTSNAIARWNGTTGAVLKNSVATIDDGGTITAASYSIGVQSVLSSTTLGSSVTSSSLTSATSMNIAAGQSYSISGTVVLSSTSLGSGITGSSLTSVGALGTGSIGGSFGTINIGANALTCGSVSTTSVACSAIAATQYLIGAAVVLSGSTLGSSITASSLTSIGTQSSGINIATSTTYKINAVDVLSATTLGSSVTASSLTSVGTLANLNVSGNISGTLITAAQPNITSVGTQSAGLDIASGTIYKINAVAILSSTTLGSSVTASSLTSVATLIAGSIGVGFGSINIGSNTITAGNISGTLTTASQPNITSIGTQSAGLDIASGQTYKINAAAVLSSTTLGATVVNSSLTSIGTQSSGIDIASGTTYKINATAVLSNTTLGSSVTASSLTSLGILTSLAVGGAGTASAIASFNSTAGGLLPPRMTTAQKLAIASPATGLVVFDTGLGSLSVYGNSVWSTLNSTNTLAITATTHTVTNDMDVIEYTATSNAIAVTLPDATLNRGKEFTLVRTDTTLTNAITITVTGGRTIGGSATRYMWTANETWQIKSNGTSYIIMQHYAQTDWITATTVTIANMTKPGSGILTDENRWRRNGCTMEVKMTFAKNLAGGTSTDVYMFSIPAGRSHTLPYQGYATPFLTVPKCGTMIAIVAGVAHGSFNCVPLSTTQYFGIGIGSTNQSLVGSHMRLEDGNSVYYAAECNFRILYWDQ